jgi:asparagine synthase (glutamine-hydrolysing)
MCGICGFVRFDGLPMDSNPMIQKMADKIIHRGPDNFGYYLDDHCALGFRRLSIIDLETGNQPIQNESGTIRIVFNGEIYNFQELRKHLMNVGHSFYTNTDTEVIVHAYEEYGTECLKFLKGMFAFALWDSNKRQLFLARDRVGKKPLFYFFSPNEIIFASELKSLLQHPHTPREIDLYSLDEYLMYGYVNSPRTILNGVKKLAPGSFLLVSEALTTPIIDRFWELDFSKKINLKEEDISEQLRETIVNAVRLRMVSDVPLGVLLSGGIDSTIVTGIMAGISNRPVNTFSIGFEEMGYNELPYARLVADRYKTNHHELIIKPDIAEIIPKIIYSLDEPMDDSSAIPTFFVAQMARQYVTVSLNGDGADESFSGYDRYGEMLKLLSISKSLPININAFIRSLLKKVPDEIDIFDFFSKARTLTNINHLNPVQLILRSYQKWESTERFSLYHSDVRAELLAQKPILSEDLFLAEFKKVSFLHPIDQMLAIDNQMYLPNDLLVKMDRMCMANSLEARSPFLDQDVIQFAASLPVSFKRKAGHGKLILRKVFSDLIPAELLQRPKHGFRLPLGHWFRKELKDMLFDYVLGKDSSSGSFFNPKTIDVYFKKHQNGEDFTVKLWGLFVFELWIRELLSN